MGRESTVLSIGTGARKSCGLWLQKVPATSTREAC
jgi:hypothetical protein